jgi:hypothetical protein
MYICPLDHNGATPLIQAVKNGDVEIVRALLDKGIFFLYYQPHAPAPLSYQDLTIAQGADPNNGSSLGRPEQYTSDSAILDLLESAQRKVTPNGMPMNESGYAYDALNSDANGGSSYGGPSYYPPPPPEPYGYYPGTAPPGAVYYSHPPPPPSGSGPDGPGNLPPPEVAQFIPCRYYPACRYGSSCMFAHPPDPYHQGPLPPPAQYPAPYDPSTAQQQPYVHNYFTAPPSFRTPPNGVPSHMSPVSPISPQSGPHHLPTVPMVHAKTGSEHMVSPAPAHFSPNGVPPHAPYVSPSYPHSGQVPVPLPVAPLPPVHHPPPPTGPQSPPSMYNNVPHGIATGPASPFTVRPGPVSRYPPLGMEGHGGYPDVNVNGVSKSPTIHPHNAYGTSRPRGGSFRRGSFTGRKPPCLFFPSGRCRNGYVFIFAWRGLLNPVLP